MALVRTTVATGAAVGIDDVEVTVTSATSIVSGRFMRIDDEWFKVRKGYVSGTIIPVTRGLHATAQLAHVAGAGVVHGAPEDFDAASATKDVTNPIAGRAVVMRSYSASGAIALPNAGEDMYVQLNGTSVLAMTVAAPGVDLDGAGLYIQSNGAAAHTVTFAGGLSGAGGSYDVLTVNATAPVLMGPFRAVNGLWMAPVGVAMSGTVTNITAALA